MVNHITTKQILTTYDISRQTLYNWINEGLLKEPQRDWRGWRVWTNETLAQIDYLINYKSTENTKKSDSDPQLLEISNRRYLGSKQKLIDFINGIIDSKVEYFSSFFEPFGGTGVVSNYYNNLDKKIIINDILYSNFVAYNTFFGKDPYDIGKIRDIIHAFNIELIEDENYYSKNFANKYFTLENARKIGYIRDKIDELYSKETINTRERDILITSLIYSADKSANTCGHYDAYRENLDTLKSIELQVPNINDKYNFVNEICNEDANQLVRRVEADVTYIDTPYNSRQYGDAYHLLENIAQNKKPELTGKAMKMVNRKHIKSDYCTTKAVDAFRDLIVNLNTNHILVSYNNMAKKGNGRSNAKISNEEIMEILSEKGNVEVFSTDFNAFTTGKSKIEDHKELIYYVKVR